MTIFWISFIVNSEYWWDSLQFNKYIEYILNIMKIGKKGKNLQTENEITQSDVEIEASKKHIININKLSATFIYLYILCG